MLVFAWCFIVGVVCAWYSIVALDTILLLYCWIEDHLIITLLSWKQSFPSNNYPPLLLTPKHTFNTNPRRNRGRKERVQSFLPINTWFFWIWSRAHIWKPSHSMNPVSGNPNTLIPQQLQGNNGTAGRILWLECRCWFSLCVDRVVVMPEQMSYMSRKTWSLLKSSAHRHFNQYGKRNHGSANKPGFTAATGKSYEHHFLHR